MVQILGQRERALAGYSRTALCNPTGQICSGSGEVISLSCCALVRLEPFSKPSGSHSRAIRVSMKLTLSGSRIPFSASMSDMLKDQGRTTHCLFPHAHFPLHRVRLIIRLNPYSPKDVTLVPMGVDPEPESSVWGCTLHSEPSVIPDEGLQAGTGDGFRDVREELQAELTHEVVLLLQYQEHKVGTHTVECHDGDWSHSEERTLVMVNPLNYDICI